MDVRLPKLGEGAESGQVAGIFVREGDRVEKDQPLIEMENEKAVAPIPSPAAGVVSKIHVKVGDKISSGQLIVTLEGGAPSLGTAAAAEKAPVRVERAVPPAAGAGVKSALGPAASPSVRKMAREFGIDLSLVPGSARGGRVVPEDIRAYLQALQSGAASLQVAGRAVPSVEAVDFSKWGPVERQPLSSLRRTIARKMSESWTTIPHVFQFDEADVTALLAARKKHEVAYKKAGAVLTLTVILLKIVANLLKKHPKFNVSLDEAKQEIVAKKYIHISVAVDTDAGLMAPVIRDVDKKAYVDLAKELAEMAEKARTRTITAGDLQGGTFAISNQGGIGGGHFTPIIKKPESAILGVGRGKLRPVIINGAVEPRMVMPLCLSYDHRVADGADAARCIRDLVAAIEHFSEGELALKK